MIEIVRPALVCLLICGSLKAQQRVDASNLYQRLICVVPIVGTGTYDDPKRPLFAPVSPDPLSKDGILAYSWQPTDDGNLAIVQFVAKDRKAFASILAAGRADVRTFVRGEAKRGVLEVELKRLKRSFDMEQLTVVVP